MGNGNVHTSFDDDSQKWVNRREGSQRASSTHDTAAEASERGKDLARNSGSEWLKHRKDNGRIHDRNTYGDDPNPPKG
ncbi:DUF2188 domain-containing protein [Microbacterium sp. LWO13-1.2]|uniref:DUF2188 domain-containing protein n=1 Tax=Microbacterium sp. LWO13-1.2 TaxID=3135262 RepID=UPI00313878E6